MCSESVNDRLIHMTIKERHTPHLYLTIPSLKAWVLGRWVPSRHSQSPVAACVAVCCSVLQCVEVCCSVLQCVAVCCSVGGFGHPQSTLKALPCKALQ